MSAKSLVCLVILILHVYYAQGYNDECDKLGILLYEDVGCTAVLKPGSVCPIKYECDLAIRNNTCLFRGKVISTEERPEENVDFGMCNIGCFCRKGFPESDDFKKMLENKEPMNIAGVFTCAILDCPEWLGVNPIMPGCYRTYELDRCCSTGNLCQENKPSQCEVEGKKIFEGQRFYPKDTCTNCICPKNFNGKFEAPHCKRQFCDVQVRKQREVSNYCAPYYSGFEGETICCPSDWICPSDEHKIVTVNPNAKKADDMVCRYGKKSIQLGEGFETTVKGYDLIEKPAKCECILPPFLTCRQVKK